LRILLVSPRTGRNRFLSPPTGLWRIKGWLDAKTSHETDVWDPNIEKEPDVASYDIVGATCLYGSWRDTLADLRPRARILVAGGPEATFNPEVAQHADIVVRGQGEKPMQEIADGKTPRTPIPMTHREFLEATLATDYDQMRCERYWEANAESGVAKNRHEANAIHVTQSDRCGGECVFCSQRENRRLHAQTYAISAEAAAEQIQMIANTYPDLRRIIIRDDDALHSPDRMKAMCSLIEHRIRDDIDMCCSARCSSTDADTLDAMKAANFAQIGYGAEHFSDRVLSWMRKRCTAAQNHAAIRATIQRGITPIINAIMWPPEMSRDDIETNIEALQQYRKTALLSINDCLISLHGTELAEKYPIGDVEPRGWRRQFAEYRRRVGWETGSGGMNNQDVSIIKLDAARAAMR